MIARGDRRRPLYVVRAGTAVVEGGEETAPVLLGAGEVFGELSFLSNEGASASVVALEELEVGVLERDHLYRLLEQLPDLAGRFYKSLAVLVANRLRVTQARIGALRPEDVRRVLMGSAAALSAPDAKDDSGAGLTDALRAVESAATQVQAISEPAPGR